MYAAIAGRHEGLHPIPTPRKPQQTRSKPKSFGVSRTPVRDALSRISHLGLIETRNGVGTVVVALTETQILRSEGV